MGSVQYTSGSELTSALFSLWERRWMILVSISLNQFDVDFEAVWFERVSDEFCWEICSEISDYYLSFALC